MKPILSILALMLLSALSHAAKYTPSNSAETFTKATMLVASTLPEWKKVKNGISKNTHLVIFNQPRPENVENVVFISAGQQKADPLDNTTSAGYPNVLTGQYRYYKKRCYKRTSCTTTIKNSSLAMQVSRLKEFPRSKTLMILVFDSRFNHLENDRNKQDILEAIWNLLTKRFYSGKVRKIVLSGQSKGGCISFELAKRFRNTPGYDKIPLILQGYDPVCRKGRLLRQGNKTFYMNPVVNKPHYKSVAVNMDVVFPSNKRQNLAILNIHSGAPVIKNLMGVKAVHSFTFKPNNIDMGWWKQTWVRFEHTDMGGNMDHKAYTVTPGLHHIQKYAKAFAGYQPPGGGILNSGKRKCPVLFPKQVGTRSGNPVCTAKFARKIKTKNCSKNKGMQWQGTHCIWGKNKYWHARPFKRKSNTSGSGASAPKCPAQYPRNVSTLSGKPVCMAVLSRKIKRKKCNSTHGGYCVWNNGRYYKARILK